MENRRVDEEEFIAMMRLWVFKKATYPLEVIKLIEAESGAMLVAILDYGDLVSNLYLGGKSYTTYQSALTKVGALMDKMDYPETLKIHKANHPLSYPAFCSGYADESNINPYQDEFGKEEWELGKAYRKQRGG